MEGGEEGIRWGKKLQPIVAGGKLIAYSENNVPYPRSSEGPTLAEATFAFFFNVWCLQKEERLGVPAVLGV